MNSMILSLTVILVFALIGWRLFRNVKAPKKWWAWVLVIWGVIVAGFVGTSTILIGFPGFEIHLNDALQGIAIGALARFILMTGKPRKLAEKGV